MMNRNNPVSVISSCALAGGVAGILGYAIWGGAFYFERVAEDTGKEALLLSEVSEQISSTLLELNQISADPDIDFNSDSFKVEMFTSSDSFARRFYNSVERLNKEFPDQYEFSGSNSFTRTLDSMIDNAINGDQLTPGHVRYLIEEAKDVEQDIYDESVLKQYRVRRSQATANLLDSLGFGTITLAVGLLLPWCIYTNRKEND